MDTHPLGDHVATRCDFFGILCVVAILLLRPSQPNPVPRVQFLALCICNQHKESALTKEEDTKYHEIVSYILNFQYLIDIQIYLLRNVASCLFCTFCLFVCFVCHVAMSQTMPPHSWYYWKALNAQAGWCTEEGVLIMFRFYDAKSY